MERLTEVTDEGIWVKESHGDNALKTLYQCYGAEPLHDYSNCVEGYCGMEKLSEYENAEEDGLLVRLPCKAGDRIWILEKLINSGEWRLYGKETIITDIYLNAKRPPLFKATNLYGTLELSDFGDIAFTTEEAAWKRLKEIESKN